MKCLNCNSSNVESIGTLSRMNPAKWNEVVDVINLYECLDCGDWFDDLDLEGVKENGENE